MIFNTESEKHSSLSHLLSHMFLSPFAQNPTIKPVCVTWLCQGSLLCLALLHQLLRVLLSNIHLYFDPSLWLLNENESAQPLGVFRGSICLTFDWFSLWPKEQTGVYVFVSVCVPEKSIESWVAVVTVITFNSASGRKRGDKGGVAAV